MRIVTVLAAGVLVAAAAAPAFAGAENKCAMCHTGDKALDKIVAVRNIRTTADLMKTVKEGPNAPMHAKFSDDDIKAAAKSLNVAD